MTSATTTTTTPRNKSEEHKKLVSHEYLDKAKAVFMENMEFMGDLKLQEVHKGLFDSLFDHSVKPTSGSKIRREVKSLRDTMDVSTTKLVKMVTKINEQVFSLEQSCRPQSQKRHQDYPDQCDSMGEKRSK
ncbi:hypothetical protein Tco_1435204 [Tanacetum coccineum]